MRKIFLSSAAKKNLWKFLKVHPELEKVLDKILTQLKSDVHHSTLKTHKLHGKLINSYGCTINHKYRLIFSFDKDLIYLESIGSHDDVY